MISKMIRRKCNILIIFCLSGLTCLAQTNYSEKLAATVMLLWKDSMALKKPMPAQWTYDQGLVLCGIEKLWKHTGKGDYYNYIQKSMDFFVGEKGNIRTYRQEECNLDNIAPGRNLLMLFEVTGKDKYLKAASLLREQLKVQPRTSEGGFWHKKKYPFQMWLDGLYMAEPFYCAYAKNTSDLTAFNDIANQFILMESHTRDVKTGLLYHAWDETRSEKWANKETGCSPNFWARAMGWYGMALVDVLDNFPESNPKRKVLGDILKRYASAIIKFQDSKTGVWYQVLDKGEKKGNYLEASASCQIVYTLAKALRMGYIDQRFSPMVTKGYKGIIDQFISKDERGIFHLNHCCQVAGLGGSPYRDGSYEYYINEPIITDDPKGLGAFLHAAIEMEVAKDISIGKSKKVVLDYYFNNEWRKNGFGIYGRKHYTWDDTENGGFSLFGNIWSDYGATRLGLDIPPTLSNLKNANVYIMVDPDGLKDTKTPNYMDETSATEIKNWVKQGGVLLLMTNDSNNCDLKHFNILSDLFGIHFSDKSRNMVTGNNFEMGAIYNRSENPVFRKTHKMYLKEISVINIKKPAHALIKQGEDVVFAISKYGKGTVFAVGDPWLYNEYLDGRKIPAEYENFTAAKELVKWALLQVKN